MKVRGGGEGGEEEGDCNSGGGGIDGRREEKERRLSPSEGYVISACALVGCLSIAGTTYLTHCP